MQFYVVFFKNISILITCVYIFNLVYKYLFLHTSARVKQAAVLVMFILSGWLTMIFGIRVEQAALFDLRVVPLVFGTLVFRDPRHLLIIGTGIAMARFTITDFNTNAVTAAAIYLALSCLAALLVVLFRRLQEWGYWKRAATSILTLNTLQVVLIFGFGTLPPYFYLQHVAVYTYPLGLTLSGFFVFIIRDFYKEQQRVGELRNMNLVLRRQTRELREAKRELEEKARQLLMASRYKSEFMANMSHELKTPLNSIILLSQLIHETDEATSRSDDIRYAEIIHNSGNELLQMINDILDLSKVEAGKMDVVRETVALEDIAQLLHHQLQPMAERKGLAFSIDIDADVPATMVTDPLRLSQILRNLLVNAVKFTESGSVTMRITVERPEAPEPPELRRYGIMKQGERLIGWSGTGRKDAQASAGRSFGTHKAGGPPEGKDVLVFAVRDTGIGIEPDKQQLIFEAFQQEDGAINRKYGGTGLGLSISLQFAHLLGGGLRLESVKNGGSTFSLRLPLERAEDEDH